MAPHSVRNFRLRRDRSVQVILAWIEMLELRGQDLIWGFWSKPQEVISEIFDKHRLGECMGMDPPFSRTFYNCETLLKSTASYTTQSDIEQTLDRQISEINTMEVGSIGIRQKVKVLMESRDGEGIKQVVRKKSKALLAMMKFLRLKQSLGRNLMRAYEAMVPLQQAALQTSDTVFKGELSLKEGIRNINHTITAVETFFEKTKLFLETEPTVEEYDGSCLAFGTVSCPLVLDQDAIFLSPHSPEALPHAGTSYFWQP